MCSRFLCSVSITCRDCPQKLCLNFPANLESLPGMGKPEGARLIAQGHQRASSKQRPEQQHGSGTVAAALGRAAGVGKLRAECVWPPGRRAGPRAMVHTLQLAARTAHPLQQFIPRRLGEASDPGLDRESQGK